MREKVYELINKYAIMMAEMEFSAGDNPRIFLKNNGNCYFTKEGSDFTKLKEEDILKYNEAEVSNNLEAKYLMMQKGGTALVISNTPYCKKAREQGRIVYATLDDMAQIVGPKVDIIDYNQNEIKNALKTATGCFVREKYTINTGRSIYEAIVAMKVLEKSAEITLKAEVLGGSEKINIFEAKLMRLIYKKKYSKAEDDFKASEVEKL